MSLLIQNIMHLFLLLLSVGFINLVQEKLSEFRQTKVNYNKIKVAMQKSCIDFLSGLKSHSCHPPLDID